MSSGKALSANLEISPTNRGMGIEQRSCQVRMGELGSSSCAAGGGLRAGVLSGTPPVAGRVFPRAGGLLLPVANSLGVRGIAEIIWVVGLGQPSLLALAFSGLAAVGLKTKALTRATPVIWKKKFLAVQALAAASLRLHRFQKQRNQDPTTERKRPKKIQWEEDSE